MTAAAVAISLVAAALNALAGTLGAVLYYRVQTARAFWPLVRAAQAAGIVLAAFTGVLAAAGRPPHDDLFYLYALLPVAVAFIAEQLRIATAQTVLDARGLADARAVGREPERVQRSIVTAILRREMGVMALAALVACFLALRAAGTASF